MKLKKKIIKEWSKIKNNNQEKWGSKLTQNKIIWHLSILIDYTNLKEIRKKEGEE
jgi:hypothetical protein